MGPELLAVERVTWTDCLYVEAQSVRTSHSQSLHKVRVVYVRGKFCIAGKKMNTHAHFANTWR